MTKRGISINRGYLPLTLIYLVTNFGCPVLIACKDMTHFSNCQIKIVQILEFGLKRYV